MAFLTTRRTLVATATALALSSALTLPVSAQDVTLTWLTGNTPDSVATAERLVADFEAANPGINIEYETRPGGADGDNIVKTRLATGEMTDIFDYNTGSLFQAINPVQNLVPVTDEAWQGDVLDSLKVTVTGTDVNV